MPNAWRHIVNRFKADGATNVGFWWCPGEQAGGVRPQIDASYPGDAYVDWVGSDDYNRDSSGAYSACRNGWVEWSWEFNYDSGCGTLGSTEQEWGPRKPFVDGETGSKYDTLCKDPAVSRHARGGQHTSTTFCGHGGGRNPDGNVGGRHAT